MVFHKDLEDNKWVIPALISHEDAGQGTPDRPLRRRRYEALIQPKVAQIRRSSAILVKY